MISLLWQVLGASDGFAGDGAAGSIRYPLGSPSEIASALELAADITDRRSIECSRRLHGDFADVVLAAYFQHHVGCVSVGYFADGLYVDDPYRASLALASAGWWDASKRRALALAWTRVLLEGSPVRGAFGLPDPTARIGRDGSVRVLLIQEFWPTTEPILVRERVQLTFSPNGDVIRDRRD